MKHSYISCLYNAITTATVLAWLRTVTNACTPVPHAGSPQGTHSCSLKNVLHVKVLLSSADFIMRNALPRAQSRRACKERVATASKDAALDLSKTNANNTLQVL
jgi:hypothetical protein